MRAAGAAALVFGCVLLGLLQTQRLIRRRQTLAEAAQALRFIGSELQSRQTPLPDIFEQLSESCSLGFGELFCGLAQQMKSPEGESFQSLWKRQVKSSRQISLSPEQRLELCRLGASLGRYEVGEQTAALESCIERLERQLLLAQEKEREGKRLYTGLGLAAGLMLAAALL